MVEYICNKIIGDKYKIVLISGNGAAGKSTFANTLQNELQKKKKTVQVLSTDNFMLDKAYRKSTIKTYLDKNGQKKSAYMASTFPEAYDFDLFKHSFQSKDSDVIIIEGIGAAFMLDTFNESYKIFLQVDKEIEHKRRIKRARSNADLSRERMDIRYEQFELFILPLSVKFDLKLISQEDFSYIEE